MSKYCPTCEKRRERRQPNNFSSPSRSVRSCSSADTENSPSIASLPHYSTPTRRRRKIRRMSQRKKQQPQDPLATANASSTTGIPNQVETTIVRRQEITKTPRLLHQILLKWLQFYVRFLQTSPLHQDRLLKALQWTSWLASLIVTKNSTRSSSSNRCSSISKSLATLSTHFSFARYATRLLEWPAAVEAALMGTWTVQASSSSSSSSLLLSKKTTYQSLYNWLGRLTSWSMVGYYPTECLAYLFWMAPPQPGPAASAQAARWSARSCRFWLLFVVAEAAQCMVQLRQIKENDDDDGDMDDGDMDDNNKKKQRHLRLQLLRDALFLLPCVQWSLPQWDTKPWLPVNVINGLMWAESMVSLYQAVVALPPAAVEEPNDDNANEKEA